MNRNYDSYNRRIATGKEYIGVEHDGSQYSSLSMGAGEQRIFFILGEVFKAPKYSLILIDEIDLLLHDDALARLLQILIRRADDKDLQIIFTTHAQQVTEFKDQINIRHISQTSEKTLCFNETKPDAIYRLTGKQEKTLEIFVEDDLSRSIIKKVCGELSLSRHVSIREYGAAKNCFTVLSGMLINEDSNLENMLFVLDGDVYRTSEERAGQVAKILTGDTPRFESLRTNSLKYVRQFIIDDNYKPEKYLHKMLIDLIDQDNEEYNEIIRVARDIRVTDNSHKYVDDIITRMDFDRSVGLKMIIDVIAHSSRWKDYTGEIRNWLISKKDQVSES